jgi:CDP-diacylglycerol--glycerol-3-phosphate 3-phosphatidyltransferase
MSAPSSVGWPNRISIARILLVGPFVLCLLHLDAEAPVSPRYIALGIFALMAATDWLDGFLARRLRSETPLGRFLDPLGDKLLITASVILLAAVGVPSPDGPDGATVHRLPVWLAAAVIGKDLLITAGFITLTLIHGRAIIEPRPLGKLCTCSLLILVMAFLLEPDWPAALSPATAAMVWVVALLVVAASIDYVRLGLRLLAAAPNRQKEPT